MQDTGTLTDITPDEGTVEITEEGRQALQYDFGDDVTPEEAEELAQFTYEFSDLPGQEATLTHKEANRILSRMAREEREIRLIDEQEADELERVRLRAAELREAHKKRLGFLDGRYSNLLKDFAAREIEGGKTRSVKLLSGRLGFRQNPSSMKIIDPAAALAWAKENLPNAVKVVESVQVTPLKSYAETTGEFPEFVEYTAPYDKFYVEATD